MLKRLFRCFNPEPVHTGFAEVKPSPCCYDIKKLELRLNPMEEISSQYEIWVIGYNITSHDTLTDGVPLKCVRSFGTLRFAEKYIEDNAHVEVIL